MSAHLTEDDLVLRHYGEDGLSAGQEGHLRDCARCQAALAALGRDLEAVPVPEPPDRGDGYGREVWRRLQPRLAAAARPARRRPLARAWAPLALAASLVLAFLAGREFPSTPAPPAAVPEAVRERILLVAVGDHLQRSQMLLVELVNADGAGGEVDISAQQQWAEELVGANRLYRQTLARGGDPALQSLLDELERLLVEVTHRPSSLPAGEMEQIRGRIDARGLLFRVRVIETQVRQKGSAGTESS